MKDPKQFPWCDSDDDGDTVEIALPFTPEQVMGVAVNTAQFYLAASMVLGPELELMASKLTEAWTNAEHLRLMIGRQKEKGEDGDSSM